eukprot:TRINITY_DN6579_c0_g1_i1.p1 TRINITY_DN6579_c0_g1~~TRINITY_DN6579_c0_g1_i1.p1  ORF type:complete len:598 (+),score=91.15 TRINITY_DN6579_c0_g1_i1:143-1936(+)
MAGAQRDWRVFARPILETALKDHCSRPKVFQPLFLHGPRGAGKRTLLQRLLEEWKRPPHAFEHIDFRPLDSMPPWTLLETPSDLRTLRSRLETSLEALTRKGVELGCIGGEQVYVTLKKWHGIDGALQHFLKNRLGISALAKVSSSKRDGTLLLWKKALRSLSELSAKGNSDSKSIFLPVKSWEDEYIRRLNALAAWNDALQSGSGSPYRSLLKARIWDSKTNEELHYFKESLLSLHLAKELLSIHEQWRANAIEHVKKTGSFSRMLAHTATNWPSLLIELLSCGVAEGYFQPKLFFSNIDMLRKASSASCHDTMVNAEMYHDSLLLRLVALGLNEWFLPLVFLTSDSYYSFQASQDFDFPDIFIYREAFGWTVEEAKVHMVPDYFTEEEWEVIANVLGSNIRHLFEVYSLKQTHTFVQIVEESMGNGFEDVIDVYLGYLQAAVVNPAIEAAVKLLKRFAADVFHGKVQKDMLRHGSPWRHPPDPSDEYTCHQWAKLQLMDYIQALINCEYGVNYLYEYSLEVLDDPATQALLEVGLLYQQRDPQFLRPLTRAIERCLVRWLVQEKLRLSLVESIQFLWHRVMRGRSYRHLVAGTGL